jgi:hypothetical protein
MLFFPDTVYIYSIGMRQGSVKKQKKLDAPNLAARRSCVPLAGIQRLF